MDRERKTLAEFSRNYLCSLETLSILETPLNKDSAEARFAARVVAGMRRPLMGRTDRIAF